MLMKVLGAIALLVAPLIAIDARAQECDAVELQIATTPIFPQKPGNYRSFLQKESELTSNVTTVLLGDSITNRFPDEMLRNVFGGGKIANLGIEGDTTQNVLWRIHNSKLKDAQPSTVVLMIGVNNLLDGAASCAVIAATTNIITDIRIMWPNAKIIQIGILPFGENFLRRDDDRLKVNASVKSFGEKLPNYSFIEPGDTLTCGPRVPPSGISTYLPSWLYSDHCPNWQSDNLHLAEGGYANLAASLKLNLGN